MNRLALLMGMYAPLTVTLVTISITVVLPGGAPEGHRGTAVEARKSSRNQGQWGAPFPNVPRWTWKRRERSRMAPLVSSNSPSTGPGTVSSSS